MRLFSTGETVDRDKCVRGLDVSMWQKNFDYDCARALGYEFVFIKATQATSITDNTLFEHVKGARSAGFILGGYHFAYPDGDPGDAHQEAEHFARTLDRVGPMDLPPTLDVETLGFEGQKLLDWCVDFVLRIEELTGLWTIFYTSPGYNSMVRLPWGWGPRLGYRTAWVAHWDSNPDTRPVWVPGVPRDQQPNKHLLLWPTVPSGFAAWDFWQIDAARLPCFAGLCDRNLFNGDRRDLEGFVQFSKKPDLRKMWAEANAVPEWRPHSDWQGVIESLFPNGGG